MASYTTYAILCFTMYMMFNCEVKGELEKCNFIEAESCLSTCGNAIFKECYRQPCYIICNYKFPTLPNILPRPKGTPCQIGHIKGKCQKTLCFPDIH